MLKIEILNINLASLMLRFYLMMAIIIAAGFLNVWPLALLGLPIFLSALLGLRFQFGQTETTKNGKLRNLRKDKQVA